MGIGTIIKILILVGIFTALINVFMFRITKKRRTNDFNSVEEFHKTYLERESLRSGNNNSNSNVQNYTTKYNASEDYRYPN